jgi:hypothetical protein
MKCHININEISYFKDMRYKNEIYEMSYSNINEISYFKDIDNCISKPKVTTSKVTVEIRT